MLTFDASTAIIQEKVAKLLADGTIELFIGYKPGSNLLRVSPTVVKNPVEAKNLVWNLACINNLVASLRKHPQRKVGILLKGCDSRTLSELLRYHQVKKEDLYVLGIPCTGIIDPKKIAVSCDPREIIALRQEAETIFLETATESIALPKSDLIFDKCKICTYPNPIIYDELIGEEVTTQVGEGAEEFAAVEELEMLTPEERFAYWKEQLSKCTLCYACQTVCPMCFCKKCIVTLAKDDPNRKTPSLANILTFHTIRAYHMTGKCSNCGECERVCPENIPLSTLFKKVEKDCIELFGYVAGSGMAATPPLTTFAEDDEEKL